jgi:hypothetical protein
MIVAALQKGNQKPKDKKSRCNANYKLPRIRPDGATDNGVCLLYRIEEKKNKYIEIIHSINVLSVLAQLPLATPLHVGGLFASKRIPNAQFPSLRGAAVAT